MASHKNCGSDMRDARRTQQTIDEETYCKVVLRSQQGLTEDELDYRLEVEARTIGLHIESPSANNLTASTSTTAIASDLQQPMSAISHSTCPTSRSSSERQPTPKSDVTSSPSRPVTPSVFSTTEKKASSFRDGFRRMSVFRKRRSVTSSVFLTPTHSEQGVEDSTAIDRTSNKDSLESPQSATSEKSTWSALPQVPKTTGIDVPSEGKEAIPLQYVQIKELQVQQRDESARFFGYQRKCLDDLRIEHEVAKKQRLEDQAAIIREAKAKNEKSLADLESRQLEAEMHLMSDLEAEKRTCLIRLRHMEAYCRSSPCPLPSPSPSSPPLTPPHSASDRSSLDYSSLRRSVNSTVGSTSNLSLSHHHTRKVTEKDFHNLAQQYRSRDTMESLHRSKIEVLRGRQEKQFSDYAAKKAREIEELEAQQRQEIETIETEAKTQEEHLRLEFEEKRRRLERRWKIKVEIKMRKLGRGIREEERNAPSQMMGRNYG